MQIHSSIILVVAIMIHKSEGFSMPMAHSISKTVCFNAICLRIAKIRQLVIATQMVILRPRQQLQLV